jgi:hypothetical protein
MRIEQGPFVRGQSNSYDVPHVLQNSDICGIVAVIKVQKILAHRRRVDYVYTGYGMRGLRLTAY